MPHAPNDRDVTDFSHERDMEKLWSTKVRDGDFTFSIEEAKKLPSLFNRSSNKLTCVKS